MLIVRIKSRLLLKFAVRVCLSSIYLFNLLNRIFCIFFKHHVVYLSGNHVDSGGN